MSGTPRPRITAAEPAAPTVAPHTLAEARESFLYSDPTWLAATDRALPGMVPFHTVARRRDDELAILPAYLVTDPALPDLDPATYLSTSTVTPRSQKTGPETAGLDTASACCGGEPAGVCDTSDAGTTAAPSTRELLPAVVIGSPLGFHSEPFFTFWTERLLGDMLAATLDAARLAGARSVLAPWLTERLTGADLGGGLRGAGAVQTFWGSDEYIPLSAASPEAHLDGLPKHQRRRLNQDHARLHDNASGVELTHLHGRELAEVMEPISELVAATYRRHGTPMPTDTIHRALLNLVVHADTHALAAYDRDGALAGVSVLIHRHPRLYVKWAGLAEHATESGLYFSLTAEEIALGYQLGARTLELGAGSYQAKRLRGSLSRTKSTALLAFDPTTQARLLPLVTEFGRHRRAAAGLDPAPSASPSSASPAPTKLSAAVLTLTPTTGTDGDSACCSG